MNEIYSGMLKNNIEVMLRVLDQETWVVDVRDHETEDYIDGFEFDNYESALAEYKNQYSIYL
jgi:hypothetical protein